MNFLNAAIFLLVVVVSQIRAQLQTCLTRPWVATCNLQPSWGTRGVNCRPRVMWWYDRNLRYCRQMWYRGCGGNNNRWCNRQQCEQICRR